MNRLITTAVLLLSGVTVAVAMPLSPESIDRLRADGQLETVIARQAEAYARGVDAPAENILPSIRGLRRDDVNDVTLRLLVILVDFEDNEADEDAYPPEHFESMLFSVDDYETGSMNEWYEENSYGEVEIIGDVVGWVRMPRTYSWYVNGDNGCGDYPGNSQGMMRDAIEAVDDDVDFSDYDNNGDRYVDALFLVHAGPGAEAHEGDEDMMWSHSWALNEHRVIRDDVMLHSYTVQPEDGTIGVFCHEAGHALFGLPDLYDRTYESAGLGDWSIMASGSWGGEAGETPSHFDAWCKLQIGFIEPLVPDENMRDVEIPPVENEAVAYILWTDGEFEDEYFLVENRQLIGFDASLPGAGLLIYHVDEAVGEDQNDNAWFPGHEDDGHYMVALEQADGNWDLEQDENRGDDGDPFPGEIVNRRFDDDSTPDSRDYQNRATNMAVNDIQEDQGIITCNLRINNLDLIEQKITADDAAAGDYFGCSVSISDNYAIIGAYCNDDDGWRSGSAYIFVSDGDDWTQQAKLTANDATEGDVFGISVSISCDYAIVGARGNDDDDNGVNSGSAYIFVRDGDDWTQQAKLTASDAAAFDDFGNSVSISGDHAIVGSYFDDDDGGSSGSAYIFVRDGDDWTQQAKLTADDADAGDYFGGTVSIDGDYAVVGAALNDYAGHNSGSAYIFVRDGDDWTEQAKLTANDAAADDCFGRSVSISGDYAVVGANGNDDDGNNSGSAYIFVLNDDDWTQQVKLTANDAAARDEFGYSVSIDGDYAIVGAYRNDDDGDDSGSAYIFIRNGGDWTEQVKLTANDAAAHDWFGSKVSISGDYAVVGAPGNDDDGETSGSAYIYDLSDEHDLPNIATDPNWLNFGEVVVDEHRDMNLSICNTGEGLLQVENILVGGREPDWDYFEVLGDDQFDVDPGSSENITVRFTPGSEGVFDDASLVINSNDPDEAHFVVEMWGRGVLIRDLTVSLDENWNLISINVIPSEEMWLREEGPDIVRMTEQLRIDEDNHHILLMKDEDGWFYAPSFGFNGIPYWNLAEGYQIKVDEDVEALWRGEPIPSGADVPLEEGWNMVAYFPTYELDASSPEFYVLSPIIDHVLMAKDNEGRFMTPEYNYSGMLPWRETQGYQVKVDADVTLNYPEERDEGDALRLVNAQPEHFAALNTGRNMSLLITNYELRITDFKDPIQHSTFNIQNYEISAFSPSGLCVGAAVLEGDAPCGMAVWGDDPATEEVDGLLDGEAFSLRLWDADRQLETDLQTGLIYTGGLAFEADGFVALDVAALASTPVEFRLYRGYPNPFNSVTRLTFDLAEEAFVNISVYDVTGRFVAKLADGERKAGHHSLVWDASATSAGVYVVRMEAGDFSACRKLVLIK